MLFAGIGAAAADERVEQLKKAIEATTDVKEQARLHRQLGEHYTFQNQLEEAAEQYLKALSLARDAFSPEERKTMAVHLSWAGRRQEAVAELRGVVAEEPGNLDARIHLARILSWMGEQSAAVEEADRALRESPGNRDALLVKANALRWKGDAAAAIPVYRRLLEEKDDFDARLGLGHALLVVGDIKGAREASRGLAAEAPQQEKDLEAYRQAERAATRPSIDLRYNYYDDSDDNIANSYTLLYGFLVQNWRLTLRYGHTDAKDPRRDVRADHLSASASVPLTARLRVRGGAGVTRLENGDASNVPTGHVGGEASLWRGTVGAGVSREALTDIAQLIDNKIKVNDAELVVSQQLAARVSFYGEYHYRDYSNTNFSHDLLLSPSYVIYAGNPHISVSYRFRYRDFDRQTRGGYFDPQGYVAHQGTGSVSFELGRLYGTGFVFGGYESFRDPEQEEGDFLGGGGTLGFRPTSNLSLEIDGITSSAAGPAAGGPGFRFFSVGARLLYRF
ncbi:MAG: tetratricopeptide repeat protein [Candidatus Rokubacteria bacterium]|nr:tetratricopeptide repeat protein [Candidatus Rokubacteria bacterium]